VEVKNMYIYCVNLNKAEGMKLAEPIYVTVGASTSPVLAAREGAVLDENLIKRLLRYGVSMVDIFSEEAIEGLDESIARAQKRKENNAKKERERIAQEEREEERKRKEMEEAARLATHERVVRPPASIKADLPPETIAPIKSVIDQKLKEEAIGSIQELFTCFNLKPGETLNKTTAYQCVSNVEKVVSDLVDVLEEDAGGFIHISSLKSFDEYTYHHSLSVALLSMSTGRALKLHEDVIFRLGRCAMMHDIGKKMVPLDIINKKGKLTDAEYEKIKHHAIQGAITLKNSGIGDIELWNAVMFHHEKVDGSGYPKGLHGKDIPLFSKIIAVADVYDAITSYRTYRNPLLPSETFEIIRRDVNKAFDYEVVKAFFEKLDFYPINTIVELSDGRLGIVIADEASSRSRLRPTIRIWGTSQIEYLAAPINMDISIVNVHRLEDFPSEF